MVYEGDEPGGERCTVLTAGSETDVQRCVPSVVDEKIGAVVVAQSGTGTELGSSDPAVKCEKSDRGALIKLTNLGATSQFRKSKERRAGKKSSRQLLGTEVQVNGNLAKALLDPGCEAELVLSASFATSCGIHSHVDEDIFVEFPDGTKVPSASIENVNLCVAGISHPVRAIVVELASYEVILGKPWFTRHNPIVDWRQHRLRITVDGKSVEIDASLDPQDQGVRAITRISATQLKKVFRRNEPVYLVHLSQMGVDENPADNSKLPNAWERMLKEFEDVFPTEQPGLPPERSVAMEIDLEEGAKPVAKPAFRLSPAEMDELKKQLSLLLEKGLIRPSVSPWGAPVLFAPKKDGGLRMCLDYRALNKLTIKNKCPIPRIDEIFDRLQRAQYFTSLDLRSGYYQIRMKDTDIPKTCIRTRYGSFEFLVMPFGLTNAPSTFQAVMNEVFREYLDDFVMVYIDDILIFSQTAEDHLRHVRLILARLRQHKLFAKLSKCEFNRASLPFLGHVVGQDGVKMQQSKVKALASWPRLTTVTEVQSFLGLANYYRRFIRDFARISAPLSELTKKGVPFEWGGGQENSFQELKTAVQSAPILQLADPSKPYIVTCDASDIGIGAVLEQESEKGPHPIAFASRKLSSAEKNYPVHERELLAIVYALKEWRPYLHGSRFVIKTDHHPLRYLDTQTHLSKRQMRWMETLQEYDYEIVYVQGKFNVVADALSRINESSSTELYMGSEVDEDSEVAALNVVGTVSRPMLSKTMVSELQRAYKADKETRKDFESPEEGRFEKSLDGLLYAVENGKRRLVVPQGKLRQALMHGAHDALVAGHLGFNKAYERLRQGVTWPEMYSELKAYVRSCDSCQRNKTSNQKPIGLLKPLEVPTERFEQVSMDFITTLPVTKENHDAVMVIVDKLTKLVMFIPTRTDMDTVETAKKFFNHWYRWFGLPKKIISDRDGRFISRFWKELFRLTQTRLAMSTSHHPQTDGQTEKANRTLEEMIRHYINYQQNNWDDLLPALEHAYNSSVHATTGLAPFMMTFGQIPRNMADILIEPSSTSVECVSEFVKRMQGLVTNAVASIDQANKTAEGYANRSRRDFRFGVGDAVLLSTKYFIPEAFKERKRKLAAKFAGPYEIIEVISPVAYRLQLPVGTKAHDVFHASMLKPYHEDASTERATLPPLPVIMQDGEEEFEVESIISHRRQRGKSQYLVKWLGWPLSESTWEDEKQLTHCDSALKHFHEDARRRSSVKRGAV